MNGIRKTGSAVSLAGLVFLLFLFVFEDQLHIPSWLRVVGRMHPLLLHFPIVLVTVSAISYWLKNKTLVTENGWEILRLSAAITALATAIMGILLGIEQENKGELLTYHKWAGIFTALIAWILFAFHRRISNDTRLAKTISGISIPALILTGHWGAGLTHGENFLTEPIMAIQKKTITLEEARVFPDLIYPILNEKCGNCHLAHNQKGGLSLTDSARIAKGGKSGKTVVPGDLAKSLLLTRIHLPMTDKKHMPLSDKPQLSADEMALLEAWIKAGAHYQQKLTSLPEADSFRVLAYAYIQPFLNKEKEEVFTFSAADAGTIKKLNNNYRLIKQLGENSPALTVSFFGKNQYSTDRLKELEPIKEQILHLNLSKMPVTDEQVAWISSLPNLLRLNLNYTDITDQSMQGIARMKNIASVSLSGTRVTINGLNTLTANKNIKELFIWDSKVAMDAIASLQQKSPGTKIETGFQGADTMVVTLNKPIIKTTAVFFNDSGKIEVAHVVKGVELRYSVHGEDPDSCVSPIYHGPITITENTKLQVKAYKKGWTASEVVKADFLKAGIPVQKTILLSPADPKYSQQPEKALTDLDLGEAGDFGTKWLGYMNNDAGFIFDLGKSQPVKEVLVNALYNLRAFIFPPVSLTVWGSDDQKNWKLLNSISPEMPTKFVRTESHLFSVKFTPQSFRYLKLQGKRILKLPSWHTDKGKPGWFFLSEVIIH